MHFALRDRPLTTIQLGNSLSCCFVTLIDIAIRMHTYNVSYIITYILTVASIFLSQGFGELWTAFGTSDLNNLSTTFDSNFMLSMIIASVDASIPSIVIYYGKMFLSKDIAQKIVIS